MAELKMIPTLHTILVHLRTGETDRPYEITSRSGGDVVSCITLEEAIACLREKGMSAAQVVNGPEVYVITWGPLLAPWEGEPG